jgi:hypothetical protein
MHKSKDDGSVGRGIDRADKPDRSSADRTSQSSDHHARAFSEKRRETDANDRSPAAGNDRQAADDGGNPRTTNPAGEPRCLKQFEKQQSYQDTSNALYEIAGLAAIGSSVLLSSKERAAQGVGALMGLAAAGAQSLAAIATDRAREARDSAVRCLNSPGAGFRTNRERSTE